MSRFIVVDKSAVVFENEMALVKFPDHQRALDTIQRVRELHYKTLDDSRCQVCWSETYPCPTIKVLEGETDD